MAIASANVIDTQHTVVWLPSGYTITLSAANLQAGDQFSNVSGLVSQLG